MKLVCSYYKTQKLIKVIRENYFQNCVLVVVLMATKVYIPLSTFLTVFISVETYTV